MEALDCYAPRSLADWIGGAPQQAVSAATAEALARRAYARAAQLADYNWPLLGVGCTAAIATDRIRRGADRAFVAVAMPTTIHHYHLTLAKQSHDRSSEETLVSLLILYAIAAACDLPELPALPLRIGDLLEG